MSLTLLTFDALTTFAGYCVDAATLLPEAEPFRGTLLRRAFAAAKLAAERVDPTDDTAVRHARLIVGTLDQLVLHHDAAVTAAHTSVAVPTNAISPRN
jgi:hypothetical protein